MSNYNGEKFLRPCLDSIINQTTDISYEIVFVDDCSTDNSVDIVRKEYPYVRIIENSKNMGFARSNNIGVAHVRGSTICLFNTDIILLNNAVRIMHNYLTNHPTVGVVGAWLKNPDGSSQLSYGHYPSLLEALMNVFFLNDLFPTLGLPNKGVRPFVRDFTPRNVDYVSGAALMTRKNIIDEIGLFDEQFFMYCEETDFCFRVKKGEGLKISFLPEAQIIHYGGMSFQNIQKHRIRLQYQGFNTFLIKHHGNLYAIVVRCMYAWHYLIKMIIRSFYFVFVSKKNREEALILLKNTWYTFRHSIRSN